jgi:crotonobetainyl-CoA:carnitine CoA-transferase CaiB-like acyl-CoA transferase
MNAPGTVANGSQDAAPPLRGITVLELSHAIAGPHCAQILADHGAEVIKIEAPGGERGRTAPPFLNGDSVYFACHNRGKRSLCLDIKQAAGLRALLRLCRQADVVITNFSADVPARLGWSYDVLSTMNPRLVFAHITGFGLTGDNRDVRAYDGVIQAMSGVPDLTGPEDLPPVLAANFPADHITGYQAAIAVLMALVGRASTGQGAFLDVSMFDSYFATLSTDVAEVVAGRPRRRSANKVLTGFSDMFVTSDGAIYLAPLGEVAWQRFCPAIGHPEWLADVSYEEAFGPIRPRLEKDIATWAAARTTAQATKELVEAGVACGPVRTVSAAVSAAAGQPRSMVSVVEGPLGTPVHVPAPPLGFGLSARQYAGKVPPLGAHTTEVLREFGFAETEIRELVGDGVARVSS